jgi:acyl-coenzyme A synthetase/AMP-(fatty) acid ligase/acyl carrier protein
MLEDSQPRLIVTQTQHLSLAENVARRGLQVLNIDEVDARLPDENLGLSLSPNTLAYLLYTSGSTGTPKGVLQNHRNVLHMIKNECNGFHLCADDRLSLLYSPSVVSAARNTFDALLNGAAVFPFNLRDEGLACLTDWLIQEEITIYKSVATLFRHFTGTLTGEESFPHLRLIFLGSETVYRRDIEFYRKHFPPSCLFVVSLSATEITQFRKYFVDKEVSIPDSVVPVGYPEEDLHVLLLDEGGKEVGVGTIGQIAVKSRYLSLGYWRRPDLNQSRFLPDPSGGGERIYLTGDLGRMQDDGCLIHVGREDFQVKIRGNRVEVGEIETALLDHPGVREAVVVAHEDARGEKRLAAYLVASRETVPTARELRRSLVANLPEYMVPTAFVFLDALPLTPSGKVNRLTLPVPDQARPEIEDTFVAPGTSVEQVVAGIWAEILGLEQIGVHDNFFELGGHSLLLAGVYSKLQETFGEEISLLDMLKYPTVKALSTYLGQKKSERAAARQCETTIEKPNAGNSRFQELYQRRQRAKENG